MKFIKLFAICTVLGSPSFAGGGGGAGGDRASGVTDGGLPGAEMDVVIVEEAAVEGSFGMSNTVPIIVVALLVALMVAN